MNFVNGFNRMIYIRFVASLILQRRAWKKERKSRCLLHTVVYSSDKCGIPRNSNFIELRVHRVITETISLTLE